MLRNNRHFSGQARKGKYASALRGRYIPTYPLKYKGNLGSLIFKSKLEYLMMRYCDINPNILYWTYEPPFAHVPYYDKVKHCSRIYYVDFVIWAKVGENTTKEIWVEIKSSGEAGLPQPTKRATKAYVENTKVCITNQCKWEAAKRVCEKTGRLFLVLTEKELLKNV